jgi:phosphate uptake regulator
MFKNLLSFWKGKDFLSQVLEDFKTMLNDTESMYQSVCARLLDNEEQPDLKNKIYEIDKSVNILQKHIRQRIVEHLALQPSVDTTACLLLMSVVKDAERLGDYAKNLHEVVELLEKPIDRALFSQYFNGVDKEILELFKNTKQAFIETNLDMANSAWDYHQKIGKGCDEIVKKVANSTLTVNEAVCFALIARYFKRINSHLTNIATSVVLPLSDLDYFDEKRAAK